MVLQKSDYFLKPSNLGSITGPKQWRGGIMGIKIIIIAF